MKNLKISFSRCFAYGLVVIFILPLTSCNDCNTCNLDDFGKYTREEEKRILGFMGEFDTVIKKVSEGNISIGAGFEDLKTTVVSNSLPKVTSYANILGKITCEMDRIDCQAEGILTKVDSSRIKRLCELKRDIQKYMEIENPTENHQCKQLDSIIDDIKVQKPPEIDEDKVKTPPETDSEFIMVNISGTIQNDGQVLKNALVKTCYGDSFFTDEYGGFSNKKVKVRPGDSKLKLIFGPTLEDQENISIDTESKN